MSKIDLYWKNVMSGKVKFNEAEMNRLYDEEDQYMSWAEDKKRQQRKTGEFVMRATW